MSDLLALLALHLRRRESLSTVPSQTLQRCHMTDWHLYVVSLPESYAGKTVIAVSSVVLTHERVLAACTSDEAAQAARNLLLGRSDEHDRDVEDGWLLAGQLELRDSLAIGNPKTLEDCAICGERVPALNEHLIERHERPVLDGDARGGDYR